MTTVRCYFDAVIAIHLKDMYSCVLCVVESKSTATFTTFSPPTVTTVSTETRKPLTATNGTFVITDEALVIFLVCIARHF